MRTERLASTLTSANQTAAVNSSVLADYWADAMPFALVQHYGRMDRSETGDAQPTRYSSHSRKAASARAPHQLRGRRPQSPLILVRYNNIQLAETRRRTADSTDSASR